VQDLFREVIPGVFECQFFDPERLVDLRAYLEDIWNAEPITSGERTNFVLWLYGDNGRLPPHETKRIVDAHERWTTPTTKPDNYAPF